MTDPQVFGYGSLVNLATHTYHAPRVASLSGWRRVWRHSTLRPVAFLSIERAPGARIDGIVAQVPGGNWDALDLREVAYERRDVTDAVSHAGPAAHTAVYEVSAGHCGAPDARHPVLLSYLDVVAQGFYRVHGPEGARRFFATTAGWDAPILNDRAAPRYPRHQKLAPVEADLVDEMLHALSADLRIPQQSQARPSSRARSLSGLNT
jgi:hypothetical protein